MDDVWVVARKLHLDGARQLVEALLASPRGCANLRRLHGAGRLGLQRGIERRRAVPKDIEPAGQAGDDGDVAREAGALGKERQGLGDGARIGRGDDAADALGKEGGDEAAGGVADRLAFLREVPARCVEGVGDRAERGVVGGVGLPGRAAVDRLALRGTASAGVSASCSRRSPTI